MPYPRAAENDVVVRVHAAGFTRGELDRPGTWADRAGRDRTPSVVFDVIGGEIRDRSAGLVRAGGTIAGTPLNVRPRDGRVVEPDRGRLASLAQRLRDGRLKPVMAVPTLAEAPAAFADH